MQINNDPSKGGNFKPAPAGLHNARIAWIVDLGTQIKPGFNGGPPKEKAQVKFSFELVDTNEVFGENKPPQPHFISKEYPQSLLGNSNNLRKDLLSLRGVAIGQNEDLTALLRSLIGMPCMVQVIHEQGKADPTKTYAKINSVMPSMNPAMTAPLRNPTIFFDMNSPDCVGEYQKITSDYLLETIHKSPEFKQLVAMGRIQQRAITPRGQQTAQQPQGYQQQPPQPTYPQQPPQQGFQGQQQQYQQPAQNSPQQPWAPPAQPWQQNAQNFQQQTATPPTQQTPPPAQPWVQQQQAPAPQNTQPPVWNTQQPQNQVQQPPQPVAGTVWGQTNPAQPINQPPYNPIHNHVPPSSQQVPPQGYKANPAWPNVVGAPQFITDEPPF